MNNLPVRYQNEYDNLKEEVISILSEVHFKIETEKLKGKWLIGKAILDFGPRRKYGDAVVKQLAKETRIGERDLYYCIKFAEKYPDLVDHTNEIDEATLMVDGKTPSWTRVKNELLIDGSPCEHNKLEKKTTIITYCSSCGKVMDRETKTH